jgi:hypothetical protein
VWSGNDFHTECTSKRFRRYEYDAWCTSGLQSVLVSESMLPEIVSVDLKCVDSQSFLESHVVFSFNVKNVGHTKFVLYVFVSDSVFFHRVHA